MAPIEAKIVARLRRSRGRYVSRPALAEAVYGDPGKVAALSSAVARLGRKGVEIEARRGKGYRTARQNRRAAKLEAQSQKFNCGHMSTIAEDGKAREMVAIPTRKLPAPIAAETPRLRQTMEVIGFEGKASTRRFEAFCEKIGAIALKNNGESNPPFIECDNPHGARAAVETPRLPPTLAQMLGPILAAGARDLARRYALGALARRAVALVAGPRPDAGAIDFARRGDGVYELRR